jgi:hypothetical protein
MPVDIVVREHPGGRRPGRSVQRQGGVDDLAQRRLVPRAAQVREVEHGVQLVAAQVAGGPGRIGQPHLAAQDAPGVLVGERPPGPVDVVHVVAVGVQVGGVGRLARPGVAQGGVLGQQRGRVDPDAVGAAVEPEPQVVLELGPDGRVRPVEVRLLGREQVQVPLRGGTVVLGDPGPRRAAEDGLPPVRRLIAPRPAPVAEPEPVALG